MDLRETVYWQRAPGEWVNLAPYLHHRPDGTIHPASVSSYECYRGPQRDVPSLQIELDRLHAAHPKARLAPPYRLLCVYLDDSRTIRLYDEITAILDDGFFIGVIVKIERTGRGGYIEAWETAYGLASTHVDVRTFLPILAP